MYLDRQRSRGIYIETDVPFREVEEAEAVEAVEGGLRRGRGWESSLARRRGDRRELSSLPQPWRRSAEGWSGELWL